MFKPLLAVALVVATTAPAAARDSTWLLCKGVSERGTKDKEKAWLVASVFEHRGATDRDLDVTLLYGSHVMSGTIVGGKSVAFVDKAAGVKLVATEGKKTTPFSGTVKLSGDFHTLTLTGDYDITFGSDPKAKPERLEAKLACEQLDDQAIGH